MKTKTSALHNVGKITLSYLCDSVKIDIIKILSTGFVKVLVKFKM